MTTFMEKLTIPCKCFQDWLELVDDLLEAEDKTAITSQA